MRTLLKNLKELQGKTIKSIEIDGDYSPNITIITDDESVLVMSVSAHWGRCGDYDGYDVYVETILGYQEKEKLDLLTDEDIKIHKIEEEKRNQERIKKESEEKHKADEAAEKQRKSELELLAKLKEKYEKEELK